MRYSTYENLDWRPAFFFEKPRMSSITEPGTSISLFNFGEFMRGVYYWFFASLINIRAQ